jgi:hypothetical protein
MLPVLILTSKQAAIALVVIAVYLLIARQFGLAFYQNEALIVLVIGLTVFAVVGATQGVFVRPWWLYLLCSGVLAMLVLGLTFPLIDVFGPGTLDKIGPGGTVFLLPMLAFMFSYPLGGVIQWVIGLTQKPGG